MRTIGESYLVSSPRQLDGHGENLALSETSSIRMPTGAYLVFGVN